MKEEFIDTTGNEFANSIYSYLLEPVIFDKSK